MIPTMLVQRYSLSLYILTADFVLVAAAAVLVRPIAVGSWRPDEVFRTLYADAVKRRPATDSASVTLHSSTIYLAQPQACCLFIADV